jgi:glucose/arabinose dehydrogenase
MLHIGALLLGVLPLLPSAFGADIAAAPAASGRDAKTSQTPNGFKPLVKDDRTATPLLAPQSSEGEQRIKQFQLAPGLSVKLWAAEPQLANPVAFSVDEQGRVFTSETYRYRTSVLDIRHYMFMLEDDLASRTVEDRLAQIRKWFGPEGEQALSRETEVIRRLEDTDHDGRADQSNIVADHFTSPLGGIGSGVLARNGQVWFTEIPSLWHIGLAGSVRGDLPKPKEAALQSQPKVHPESLQAQAILQGFGVRFSFTGHDLHGLIFGPDGRLYFSCGDRGAHVVTQEGTVIDLPDEGAVFRCEPDGSKLEVVHRGLRNPQELAFNDEGDLFTGDNDSDQGDRERWVQVVEGADSGWRVGHQHAPLGNAGLWNLERLWVPHFEGQSASILTPIANIGDGPSGLVHDSGTSLPRTLRGRFLLAYFKGTSAKSGISSLQQQPAGSTYELVAHDPLVWNSLVPDVDLGVIDTDAAADRIECKRPC